MTNPKYTTAVTCGCYATNNGWSSYACPKHRVSMPVLVEPPYTFRERCTNGVYHYRRAIYKIAKMLGALND